MGDHFDEFNSWKALAYPAECRAILSGKVLPPVVLHVYPTNRCNLKCRFCIMKEEQKRRVDLPRGVFERLIQSANRMGVKTLHVSGGGEPSLYQDLSLVKEFQGFRVLSTNGVELNVEQARLFNRVRVSLNASTEKSFMEVSGLNRFDQVLKNIAMVKKECEGVVVGIGFVVDYGNWVDIFELCKLVDRLGIDFVHIRPAYYSDSSQDRRVREVIEGVYHLCEAAKKLCRVKIFSISDKFDGFWSTPTFQKCLATPLHAVVAATGEFIVCQDVFIRFGSLFTSSFEEIWGSEEHMRAIGRIDLSKCPRCVMNKPNEIIEKVFEQNRVLLELL